MIACQASRKTGIESRELSTNGAREDHVRISKRPSIEPSLRKSEDRRQSTNAAPRVLSHPTATIVRAWRLDEPTALRNRRTVDRNEPAGIGPGDQPAALYVREAAGPVSRYCSLSFPRRSGADPPPTTAVARIVDRQHESRMRLVVPRIRFLPHDESSYSVGAVSPQSPEVCRRGYSLC
jgi:hypothetical protein